MVTLAWPIVALRDKLSDPVVFWFCQFTPQVRRRVDVRIQARAWTVGTPAHMTTFAVDIGLGCVPCMGAWALGPKVRRCPVRGRAACC